MGSKQRELGDTSKIELRPDGEERFRQAIHAAAKSGPMHRTAKPARKRSLVVKQKGKR